MPSSSALMIGFFYFLAAISIWLGLNSLRGGLHFIHYLKAELSIQYPEFTPVLTVFVPCRGVDDGLRENLAAIVTQDYPAFEVVFVSDRVDDPALKIIEEVRVSLPQHAQRIVMAGPAADTGQKVHNLRAAVREADPKSELFVFVDSDARPSVIWLRDLVVPLRDERIGAATGYRWFIARGFASHLRSVWNAAIASALGANTDKNFCWGGSTAIRRVVFEHLEIDKRWQGTVSDDFTLTRALHEAGLPIKFVPQCLTASFDNCTFGELLEFTTRQLKITRVYAGHLWKAVFTGSAIFVLTFFGGMALTAVRAAKGFSLTAPLVLLLIIFGLGAMKSYLRLRAVRRVIPDRRLGTFSAMLAHICLWPIASALFLYNALAALMSRRINWRSITYELKSPSETVIIRGQR